MLGSKSHKVRSNGVCHLAEPQEIRCELVPYRLVSTTALAHTQRLRCRVDGHKVADLQPDSCGRWESGRIRKMLLDWNRAEQRAQCLEGDRGGVAAFPPVEVERKDQLVS